MVQNPEIALIVRTPALSVLKWNDMDQSNWVDVTKLSDILAFLTVIVVYRGEDI